MTAPTLPELHLPPRTCYIVTVTCYSYMLLLLASRRADHVDGSEGGFGATIFDLRLQQ
jgi:hypothetical protein